MGYFQSYERGPANIFFCQIFADVYPDCNEIKLAKMDKNPLRNNLYAIDPDGAGGVPLFPAYCDFKTNERIGITEVGDPLIFIIHLRFRTNKLLIIHVQSVVLNVFITK